MQYDKHKVKLNERLAVKANRGQLSNLSLIIIQQRECNSVMTAVCTLFSWEERFSHQNVLQKMYSNTCRLEYWHIVPKIKLDTVHSAIKCFVTYIWRLTCMLMSHKSQYWSSLLYQYYRYLIHNYGTLCVRQIHYHNTVTLQLSFVWLLQNRSNYDIEFRGLGSNQQPHSHHKCHPSSSRARATLTSMLCDCSKLTRKL